MKDSLSHIPDIKMIALDLDGTTLVRGHITSRTRKALEDAIQEGVHVVVATGRVYTSLPKDIFTIKGLEYVVTSNGACVTDLKENKVIYENCIAGDKILEIKDLLEAKGHPVEIFTKGQAYIDESLRKELEEYGPASKYMSRNYVLRTRKSVEEIFSFLEEHYQHIENINIHFPSGEEKDSMWKALEKVHGITLTSSMKRNIEIGGATTSKATGLAHLCQLRGISLDETMACGDSPNDMAMLEEAVLGVAMGNGVKKVLEMADCIAPPHDEEGVAWAVEHFVLKKERPMWQTVAMQTKNRVLNLAYKSARKVSKKLKGNR